MNNDEHMIIGFFIGILIGVFMQGFIEYFDFILYLIFVSLTVFGTIVPNLNEPRHGENHRKLFHSVIMLIILVVLLLWLINDNQTEITYLSSGFILGYLSHLLLDATSPKRLPIY